MLISETQSDSTMAQPLKTHGNSQSKDDHVPAPPCAWDIAMKVQLLETALKLQPGNAIGILRPEAGAMSDQGPFFQLPIHSNQKNIYHIMMVKPFLPESRL